MKLALNYSRPAAALLQAGQIDIDSFKCPAWPDLVAEASALHAVYVHFPLSITAGGSQILDTETRQPPDWFGVERLLAQTGTPFLNVHLTEDGHLYPAAPKRPLGPAEIASQTENLVRQLRPAVAKFGRDRIIVENSTSLWPQVFGGVVEATSCGFLFDVSHAVLASRQLGMDLASYAEALPLASTREVHATGVRRLEGHWLDMAIRTGYPAATSLLGGELVDHLPMTDADWQATGWCLDRFRAGACGMPWCLTFEYGGVGGFFEATTDVERLARDVPRLRTLIRSATPGNRVGTGQKSAQSCCR